MWPLELGLGTHNPRSLAWPLGLGLVSLIPTHRRRESFLSEPWAKWKKKGAERAVFVYMAKEKKTYYCRAVLMCTAKEKKTYYHRAVLVCTAKEKKPIPIEQYLCVQRRKKNLNGCLVGLGNLPGTQLLSGVTGRVGEDSIYIRPSQAGCVGAYNHLCIGEEVEWRPPLL